MTAASLRALAADLADGTADFDAIDHGMLAALGCSHEMVCDENERLRRELADARGTVSALTLQMTVGQHALTTAFKGAVRCIDALASENDIDDARYFAEPQLLSATALMAGDK